MPGVINVTCYGCRRDIAVCPVCVPVVLVDPQTGYPPDYAIVAGELTRVTPDPDAVARAERRPVCDECVSGRPTHAHVMTHAERHTSGHCNGD